MPVFSRCAACCRQLPGGNRGNEGIGIDLAVRVREGDPDLHSPVLEGEDVGDLRPRRKLTVAVCPDFQQELEVPERQGSEGRRRVPREDDDLAGAAGRQRGHERCRRGVLAAELKVGKRLSKTATS